MKGAFGQDEERRARKGHTCDWCLTAIDVGESYLRWFGRNEDNDVAPYKMHSDCRDAITRERLQSHWNDVSWTDFHHRGMTLDETEAEQFRRFESNEVTS